MHAQQRPSDDLIDTIIVGAGLSGICAAWHLRDKLPDERLEILEARQDLGGTWDLFRYPGVRSDSDMSTLGYGFRPWVGEKAIADGPSIRQYIRETAVESGIMPLIKFGHRLMSADWHTDDQCWVLQVAAEDTTIVKRCRFLLLCSGYYRYDAGYTPALPELEQFAGRVVHPQQWPRDLEVSGKRIAIIGSGATAVTLLPALVAQGATVTQIQRTPTYIAELPARDRIADALHRLLPHRVAHWLVRWKNILYAMLIFQASRRFPGKVKQNVLDHIQAELGDTLDVNKHFAPPYNPWDQRLCIAPDGDFFAALKSGHASIETDTITGFSSTSVKLATGAQVDADVVITATGLEMQVAGGAKISIDGEPLAVNELVTYKGAMLSGVPNLAITMGYTNASWTLKCELIAKWVARLRRHMAKQGFSVVVAEYTDKHERMRPLIDLSSGYIRRAAGALPRQSDARPWTVNQNYFLDLAEFQWGGLKDDALRFARPPRQSST